uniref:Ribosomal protein L5 n=1 Tax=Percursaria percursa TaxID=153906 RepID=A0A8K1N1I8_9CHLO|nr:ribosomal protein L5 [Percursaria percursa]
MYKQCIDQQILTWHKSSIQRYELMNTSMPLLSQPEYYIKNNTNLITSDFLKQDSLLKKKTLISLTKAYFNHPKFWNNIKQITLHATSKELLSRNELYTAFYKCFCCCGQTPRLIKSKQPIAAFKVIKGAIIGAQSNLHNKNLRLFCYKWAYLAAELHTQLLVDRDPTGLEKHKGLISQGSIGINNIFVFPELDKLDYNLFQPIPGFDLRFMYNKL